MNRARYMLCLAYAAGFALAQAMIASAETPQPAMVELGKSDFIALCAPCHGEGGKGDGPAAAGLAHKPADLTQIAKHHGGGFPDTLIFATIEGLDMPSSHGSREMPVWGDVFVGEAVGSSVSLAEAKKAASEARKRIEALVLYLKSIQAD
jgi:mono/diheme cytochrome c family protein